MRTRLPRRFYDRPTLDVARELIGMVLVHQAPEGRTSGVIVEAEAYIGEEDAACHAAPGPTRRNQPLYGPPGIAYVYLNYGIHCLFNAVTEAEGRPAAVLVRALRPLEGTDVMAERRGGSNRAPIPTHRLCQGPGNVGRAMGISLVHNRLDLCGDVLFIEDHGIDAGRAAWSPRIGLSVGTDAEWRVFVADDPCVSGTRRRKL